jgi:hypothetical protein
MGKSTTSITLTSASTADFSTTDAAYDKSFLSSPSPGKTTLPSTRRRSSYIWDLFNYLNTVASPHLKWSIDGWGKNITS